MAVLQALRFCFLDPPPRKNARIGKVEGAIRCQIFPGYLLRECHPFSIWRNHVTSSLCEGKCFFCFYFYHSDPYPFEDSNNWTEMQRCPSIFYMLFSYSQERLVFSFFYFERIWKKRSQPACMYMYMYNDFRVLFPNGQNLSSQTRAVKHQIKQCRSCCIEVLGRGVDVWSYFMWYSLGKVNWTHQCSSVGSS